MKTVVVKFNNVNHVREVADDVSEEDVMRQVIAEKTHKTNPADVPLERVDEKPESGAIVQPIGKGWFKVLLDGKVVSPRALRKQDALTMQRELNLGTYTAQKPVVIGAPASATDQVVTA